MKTRLGMSILALAAFAPAQDPQDAVASRIRETLKDNAADFWIYDDLEEGYKTAKQTGKPRLVSFRCVP